MLKCIITELICCYYFCSKDEIFAYVTNMSWRPTKLSDTLCALFHFL